MTEACLGQFGYHELFKKYETTLGSYFNYTGTLLSTEILHVEDYSKYHMAGFIETEQK